MCWTPQDAQTDMIQLNGESHFHNDLGLDSLDTVEVVMAIEEVGCMMHCTAQAPSISDGSTGVQH